MAGEVIILLGPTGAGKSFQAQRLERQGWAWLSSGELLRHDPATSGMTTTGHLVTSQLVEQLMEAAILQINLNTKIVLDGFPREMNEAKWLEAKLSEIGRPLSHVFCISVSPEVAAERLEGRQRRDDTVEAQKAKWHDYARLTVPVIEHYRHEGILVELDGSQSVEAVGEQLDRFLAL